MNINRKYWVIVSYSFDKTTPAYYLGYYGQASPEGKQQPAFSFDFNKAVKWDSSEASSEVMGYLGIDECLVEEHEYADLPKGKKELTDIEKEVFDALGSASMAWSETPKGVFNNVYCNKVANKLLEAIKNHVEDCNNKPKE